jgi:hypothetical protein
LQDPQTSRADARTPPGIQFQGRIQFQEKTDIMKNMQAITPMTAILCSVLLLAPGNALLWGQQAAPPGFHQAPPAGAPLPPPPGQALSPDQLEGLVAPIALYPDPILSQILVASTYPLELVQAWQWLQRSPGLTGPALTQAAQQQNWDASIQALVVFPDLVKRLNADITWTTDLGNAFLAQQPDVMDAVQRMRLKAQQAGKLSSTPQQRVTTANESGQPVIEIMPANPEMIYLPNYDPAYFWGPSLYYPYANWFYPPFIGGGFGFGFGLGISMGFYFGGGWGGWGGWGWHPGWGNHSVMVNNGFIHRNNFNASRGGSLRGTSTWSHDASHRGGVPYANAAVSSRYGGNVRQNLQTRGAASSGRAAQSRSAGSASGGERMGNRQVAPNSPAAGRSAFGGVREGGAAREQSNHGFSSMGPARSGGGGFGGGGVSRGGGGGGGGRR